jgi:hypothetical protein
VDGNFWTALILWVAGFYAWMQALYFWTKLRDLRVTVGCLNYDIEHAQFLLKMEAYDSVRDTLEEMEQALKLQRSTRPYRVFL